MADMPLADLARAEAMASQALSESPRSVSAHSPGPRCCACSVGTSGDSRIRNCDRVQSQSGRCLGGPGLVQVSDRLPSPVHPFLGCAYASNGAPERGVALLAKTLSARRGKAWVSMIADMKVTRYRGGSPKIRAPYEAVYFAGLPEIVERHPFEHRPLIFRRQLAMMTCGLGRTPMTAVFPMFIWSPWVILTLTRTS